MCSIWGEVEFTFPKCDLRRNRFVCQVHSVDCSFGGLPGNTSAESIYACPPLSCRKHQKILGCAELSWHPAFSAHAIAWGGNFATYGHTLADRALRSILRDQRSHCEALVAGSGCCKLLQFVISLCQSKLSKRLLRLSFCTLASTLRVLAMQDFKRLWYCALV